MRDPKNYFFKLPADNKPPFRPLEEEVHAEFQWLTRKRAKSRGLDVFEVIDTVVIHATAGYATEHAVDTWKDKKGSAHWIVPDENEPQHGNFVWATVAESKAAYHVRDKINYEQYLGVGPKVNNRSLGIEIVNTQNVQNYSDPFSEWQIEATAKIVLYAWAKYPNLKYVISHAKLDPSRRMDPGSNFPWNSFKEKVLSHSVLTERNPLVSVNYSPPMPNEYEGNCCLP